jgi:hypothetical protein
VRSSGFPDSPAQAREAEKEEGEIIPIQTDLILHAKVLHIIVYLLLTRSAICPPLLPKERGARQGGVR